MKVLSEAEKIYVENATFAISKRLNITKKSQIKLVAEEILGIINDVKHDFNLK